ncbi:hypothetical protein THOG11_270045 [Vibrio harveyi]|uniref:Uncharacterized protein n=1 Tax=Vibrio hyugaensis TaxID=1534743 RepID=A0ABQ5Y0J1_9VIBR|nr:hypothetical protein TH15OA1_310045 [Vibrio harveyi]GLR03499.1 hypothetical protein GCM10007906_10860 [Vibrio hyugaensis]CAH1533847.1 hypothetical protein VHARVF571_350029 [Vibrio harveyi]CAH1562683.1 hypothetical protein THOD03_290046 [Vibrio harveyi]CAH1568888.1 hypothetical protein THOG11_270045 [Vibrio harveyi]
MLPLTGKSSVFKLDMKTALFYQWLNTDSKRLRRFFSLVIYPDIPAKIMYNLKVCLNIANKAGDGNESC